MTIPFLEDPNKPRSDSTKVQHREPLRFWSSFTESMPIEEVAYRNTGDPKAVSLKELPLVWMMALINLLSLYILPPLKTLITHAIREELHSSG